MALTTARRAATRISSASPLVLKANHPLSSTAPLLAARWIVPTTVTSIHNSSCRPLSTTARFAAASDGARTPSSFSQRLHDPDRTTYFHPTFNVAGRVYVVTGGAQGLGLKMVEALAENGAHVHCLDRRPTPSEDYQSLKSRLPDAKASSDKGSLTYHQVDVTSASSLSSAISDIGEIHKRLDGLAAAAGIQNTTPALDYPPDKIDEMLAVNLKGVYLSAVACAKEMIKWDTPGAMLLVGSTSGFNAIKGLTASVYSCSKAGVIQMARNLAMEWGRGSGEGPGRGIRVNALCPGNIITPMVLNDFKNHPGLRETWEAANMMGRISEPDEYKGATLFLLSDASSFMTGASLVVDGGYTAW